MHSAKKKEQKIHKRIHIQYLQATTDKLRVRKSVKTDLEAVNVYITETAA